MRRWPTAGVTSGVDAVSDLTVTGGASFAQRAKPLGQQVQQAGPFEHAA